MLEASDGSFYGTSSRGGVNDFGAIYRLTPAGDCSTSFSFSGINGRMPNGGLILGQDGNYYGTTVGGGDSNVGTAFRMSPSGTVSMLFSFQGTNGSSPGRLEPASDGRCFGLTAGGGAFNLGTAFALSTNGVLTVLFSFNGTNGCIPSGGLVKARTGILYGVTQYGGVGYSPLSPGSGYGSVFSLKTNGSLTALVFFNGANGAQPTAALSLGRDGNLYGTTSRGGANNQGTVFVMTPDGVLTTLHDFGPTRGIRPLGTVTQGSDGSFYGTTAYSLQNGVLTNGTLFSLTTNGVVETLVTLDGTNGLHPSSEMILASDGNLYGTMVDVQAQYPVNGGTLFRLVPPPVMGSPVAANGSATVTWSAFSNGVYRVERRSFDSAANWVPCLPTITATGSMASFTDTSPEPAGCYYRIVLLP